MQLRQNWGGHGLFYISRLFIEIQFLLVSVAASFASVLFFASPYTLEKHMVVHPSVCESSTRASQQIVKHECFYESKLEISCCDYNCMHALMVPALANNFVC